MDRLSDLPDDLLFHIISFLPTKLAAQTSLVSRRFHGLWELSPALDLNIYSLYYRCWPNRDPSAPLHRLNLRLRCPGYFQGMNEIPLSQTYIEPLLAHASFFSLRHLSVQLKCDIWMSRTILPCILSMWSLESLSLENVCFQPLDPSKPINLKHLKRVRITRPSGRVNDFINWVIPQLDTLEDLSIQSNNPNFLHLESKTLKKLKLDVIPQNLRISTPSLELFKLEAVMYCASSQWDWDMPMLRKAAIRLRHIFEKDVEVIFKMLNAIANVQELHIDIMQSRDETNTFHALLLHGVEPPTFVNLKHFNLEIIIHEYNIEDLVTLLQYTPALESLGLVHKQQCRTRKGKKNPWRSCLPCNAEGNCRHAYFEDLHIPEKKEKVLEQLTKKQRSKRFKRY